MLKAMRAWGLLAALGMTGVAAAAVLSIEAGVAVQDVDCPRLRERLQTDGQVLEYAPPPKAGSPAGP